MVRRSVTGRMRERLAYLKDIAWQKTGQGGSGCPGLSGNRCGLKMQYPTADLYSRLQFYETNGAHAGGFAHFLLPHIVVRSRESQKTHDDRLGR